MLIRVVNILDTETIGTLYTYISNPGTLILQVPTTTAAGATYNYKFLRTSNIKTVEVISKSIDQTKIVKINELDPKKIPSVIKRNTEAVELKKLTQNDKATKEGQHIFNTLYKTMPTVRWKDNSIIILDEVKINPPYQLQEVKSIINDQDPEESDAIRLVKKIVDGVWLKVESQRKGG
ncbi:hypothetical protein BN7_496 [Wickerhamomyces ciferrii]|uniref:AD domain-containing protein n=1 Tax=Wickerhamomyces ciferrii (strain ATCC 14091 / BCRC 22168 / CBS 111 / JCM 3599 / NBRC 0793 / NRRL Y-1031 F-60-10) TaxID=1206466 RepID=K0KFF7_WICCF|nr:uncharacterized protein BN7_496 [Wickerhamomyces ciferrii]CCH40962.1 hypothetical protein BN7_496 [Wickerhamomyces ciferrii]